MHYFDARAQVPTAAYGRACPYESFTISTRHPGLVNSCDKMHIWRTRTLDLLSADFALALRSTPVQTYAPPATANKPQRQFLISTAFMMPGHPDRFYAHAMLFRRVFTSEKTLLSTTRSRIDVNRS